MRPAVHASSILRNRQHRVPRVMRPHSFSMRRLLLLLLVGVLFLIPGLVLMVMALERETAQQELPKLEPGQTILYKAIGPALSTLGAFILFSACIYYYCYGVGESNRLPGGSHQSSINSDKGHGHHGQHGGSGHAKHHNGHHQLDTPEGTVRRLSLKEESPSPQPSPRLGDEEQVPLTPSAALPVIPEQLSSSPVTIRVDQASEGDGTGDQEELLVNGKIASEGPAAV